MPALSPAHLEELDQLYRTSPDVRLRIRALMVLLAAEQHRTVPDIALVVRQNEATVRRWLCRHLAEGTPGLQDAPKSGAPTKVTAAYREQLLLLVRRRPRALGRAFSLWTGWRLAHHLAELTGLRLSPPTI